MPPRLFLALNSRGSAIGAGWLGSEEIVNALELIYKKELMQDRELNTKDKSDEFSANKGLVRGVEWYFKNKPAKVEEFKQMFESYQEKLDLLKLKDEFLNPNTKKSPSRTLFGPRLSRF